ncbi:MAG: 1-(5-phosphoribosyl)-5-[(5-phosphoribosylamino)methylideneamino]imidazole-4-carboxamide isomerase [Candidatus Bathyarchaeum sp.]|nr:MAG: 1-(5-phosphoribosyl)-5-[(5-phosphoribosylamino)methylideneamino]imidazole-4-carboxamide isomerase [Candidatus Bathyarchaeum sp.]
MLVIPAVDVLEGKCVRLVRGDPKKSKVYYEDPLEAARLLENQGAELIHLIDLDAALGSGQNMETIKNLMKNIDVKVQVGGGIRTLEKADALLKLGAYRIIFGTAAVQNPSLVEEAVNQHGSKSVAVAIDEKKGKVTYHGWKNRSEIDYLDLARSFEAIGVGALIFTSVSVDGTLKGPRIEKITKLVEAVRVPVIASGGVASLDDLVELAGTGVEGVVVGAALYEKKFTLKEALEVVKNVS